MSDATCRACGQHFPDDPARMVACPSCGANSGADCTRPSGHRRPKPHRSRDRLALATGITPPCREADNPEWPHDAAEALGVETDVAVEGDPSQYRWPCWLAEPDSPHVVWRGPMLEDTAAGRHDNTPTVQEGTYPQVEVHRRPDGWRVVKAFREPPTLREAASIELPTETAGGEVYESGAAALEAARHYVHSDPDMAASLPDAPETGLEKIPDTTSRRGIHGDGSAVDGDDSSGSNTQESTAVDVGEQSNLGRWA